MARDVSTEECFQLARAMTLKNSAADSPRAALEMAAVFARTFEAELVLLFAVEPVYAEGRPHQLGAPAP